MLGAGIHDALQLQLTQLALIHYLRGQRIPQRVAGVGQLDGTANKERLIVSADVGDQRRAGTRRTAMKVVL